MTEPATAPVAVTPRRHVVVRPSRGLRAVDIRAVWEFRDLLVTLATRDLKLRYRQTLLGASWVLIQPLLAAGIFSFVFGSVADLPSEGLPYFVFAYAGMLGWNLYSGTLGKTGTSLVSNAGLVSKVYFPRLVLPFSSVVSVVVDLLIASSVMAVLLVVYDIGVSPAIALVPVWVVGLLLLALGAGLVSSALSASYRDFVLVVPVLMQFLLYASPVAYGLDAIPERFRTVYSLNPMVGLLEAFRWSVLGTSAFPGWLVVYSLACAVVLFLVGTTTFRFMERRFADVI